MTENNTEDTDLEYRNFADFATAKVTEFVPEADPRANRLSVAVNRVSQLLIYDYDSSIHRPTGSSWSAYRILFAIWVAGPLSPARIAELTGMGKSAISNLLKPLFTQGHLTQETSAEDRRSKLLALTDSGQAYVDEIFRRQNQRETEWARTLTPIEQDLLISLLNKLLDGDRAEEVRQLRR